MYLSTSHNILILKNNLKKLEREWSDIYDLWDVGWEYLFHRYLTFSTAGVAMKLPCWSYT